MIIEACDWLTGRKLVCCLQSEYGIYNLNLVFTITIWILFQQVNAVEEALRIVLEVINSCIYNQLIHNLNLVYTLLYKRQIFEPFKKHEAFQDIIQNIDLVSTQKPDNDNIIQKPELCTGLRKHTAAG